MKGCLIAQRQSLHLGALKSLLKVRLVTASGPYQRPVVASQPLGPARPRSHDLPDVPNCTIGCPLERSPVEGERHTGMPPWPPDFRRTHPGIQKICGVPVSRFVRSRPAVTPEPVEDDHTHSLNLYKEIVKHIVAEILGPLVDVCQPELHHRLDRRPRIN